MAKRKQKSGLIRKLGNKLLLTGTLTTALTAGAHTAYNAVENKGFLATLGNYIIPLCFWDDYEIIAKRTHDYLDKENKYLGNTRHDKLARGYALGLGAMGAGFGLRRITKKKKSKRK